MRSIPFSQFLIGIFSLLILVTSITQYGGVTEYGAGFMPTVLSALLLFFTVMDGVLHCRKVHGDTRFSGAEYRSIALVIAAVGSFTVLVSYLGFLVCATVLLFVLMSIRNPKKLLLNVLFSIVASGLIYYVFAKVLMVALP